MKKIVLAKYFAMATASLILGSMLVDCGNASPDSIGGGGSNGAGGGTSGNSTNPFSLPDASSGSGTGSSAGGGSTGAAPTGDANCGSQTSSTTKNPVDVLLVLDRSGSMSESMAEDCCCEKKCNDITSKPLCKDTANCTQRWPALTSGVKAAIAATPEINWGLKLFSSTQGSSSCTVNDGVEVTIAPGAQSAAAIETRIAATSPSGMTPTAKAVTTATTYLQGVKDANNKVILLATDGIPNCKGGSGSTDDTVGTEAAVKAALTAGFKVYVIGIGPKETIPNLDKFAAAGGTGNFYPATSADDLAKALLAISQAVSSCTFTITSPPAGSDASNLGIYVNGTLVAKDPTNGWSLGATAQTVELNGSTCDLVKSKAATVQVFFGCAGGPPPPQILF